MTWAEHRVWGGLLLALLAAGCGATCDQLKREHRDILSGTGEIAPGPHVEIVVPFDMINKRLAAAVKDLEPGRLVLPEFAALNAFSGGFVIQARELRIGPGTDGAVGFRAKARIRFKRRTLTTLSLEFDAPVVADREGRRLSIGLGDLRAPPEVAEDAAKQMAKVLHPLLPGPLRATITQKRIKALCRITLMKLEEDAHRLLREPLIEPLLQAARVRVRVPDWPLEALTLGTRDGARGGLAIGITLGLPDVASVDPSFQETEAPHGVRIHLPGATAAAVANHLASRGDLPATVDEEGLPDPDGGLAVTYGWRSGRRPMKLDLWRLDAPCAALRVGAAPSIQVDGSPVRVEVTDGRLERVRGDLLVKIGAALTGLWSRVFRVELEAAGGTVVRVAGQSLHLSLAAVRAHADGWVAVLEVGSPP